MRKPVFGLCENKGADQLCGYRRADQRLCFCYIDSSIPLLPRSENSSLVCTWSETPKTVFLAKRLILFLFWILKPGNAEKIWSSEVADKVKQKTDYQ